MSDVGLNSDVTRLTDAELDALRDACYAKVNAIAEEHLRRDALPFVWSNEVRLVRGIRAALKKPDPVGAEGTPPVFAEPASAVDAYIPGDKVTVDGRVFVAVGPGAVVSAPGVKDPIRGELWREGADTSGSVDAANSAAAGASEGGSNGR